MAKTANADAAAQTLGEQLDRLTAPGSLFQKEDGAVRCLACGHRCRIPEGRRGVCKVRFNRQGELRVPFGYVAGVAVDPIEKKPFFHVLPGADALTFGMLGCDLHCSYCQNWITSQALRDPAAGAPVQEVTPQQLARAARREGAQVVVSSYNEPLITAEWAAAIFAEARQAGLLCAFVSNGNATPEVLDFLQPYLAAYKVDLKGFNDRAYRSLGCPLKSVLDTLTQLVQRGLWVEVVTLLVPGFNDDPQELRDLTRFLAGLNRDLPWHVTAFHPDYKMTGARRTAAAELMRAAEIGAEAGLRYVYAGNLPGRAGPWENTRCPQCQTTVIERCGFTVLANRLTAEGACPECRTRLPGIWRTPGVEAAHPHLDGRWRVPRPIHLPGA
ncbi:AmmeMemoRadiSam system radical SAM enzyme [Fontisphaera persica]|uniref:AmmeMemoRadiSam system radical SAM enzyme n=1 Tax=Fontisphaera persica TaxID=2974023 RepID=UPI0024BF87B6|nr:AmmeMemoRadiSam system radical SAM enzyme [Fontisphaera persica]WCJ58644.1 AmmeMemoRadiSam system radical SAM enzyme [Fontisphaera persica]